MGQAMYKVGSDKCFSHGGSTPRGIASPHFKPGSLSSRSKYLPVRMLDNFNAAMDNKELLTLREDISTVDARIIDVLQRVDTGEAGSLWVMAYKAYEDMTAALVSGNQAASAEAMNDLRGVLGRGQADWRAWGEIKDLIRLRKELSETEQKRIINLKLYLSTEDAFLFMRALAEAVRKYVSDIPTLSKIQNEFIKLTNRAGVKIEDPEP
jgi:hypothetical protein